MMFNNSRFTAKAREAIELAHKASSELGHGYVGSEHLLLGLLDEGQGVAAAALAQSGITGDGLRRKIIEAVGQGEPNAQPVQGMTPRAKRIIELAMSEATRLGHSYVGTEHILMGILREGDSIACSMLQGLGADIRRLYNDTLGIIGAEPAPSGAAGHARGGARAHGNTKTLNQFGRDLTAMAREGKLDPVIGRDTEIMRIIQILSRRTKNNPVLIGEPGVGKTAIAEGLAQKIISNEVPDTLRDKRVVTLDLSGMVAGTKYRGEFEERLKGAMDEVRGAGNVILFIDELHTLIGAGAAEGAIDAANILKPALSRGEIQVIGATTLDEYRKHVEKDAALERRFQTVIVGEPSPEETVLILRGLRDRYEAHHKLKISDAAIESAVSLSIRYIADRQLPDKAIDLIDEAASRLRMISLTPPPDLRAMEEEIERVAKEKEAAVNAQRFEEAVGLRDREKTLREEAENARTNWETANRGRDNTQVVEPEDVAAVVSLWTGVPVTQLTRDEADKLLNMEATLHKRLVGQDEAVTAVSRAIRRGRVGLKDPKRPIGSFIFLGPTGVGKTELCRALAEALFGDEKAMIRVDMSEFMEKHTPSKLIGSPPGYVGYDEGGGLTELVRRKPYSVVLFDEIEKAHPDVFNLLLQMLEDGHLTDSHGRRVDFKNTVIVMTSNLGAAAISERKRLGFNAETEQSSANIKAEVMAELKRTFKPELLNRIDETIVFTQLGHEEIRLVAERMFAVVAERLKALGVELSADGAALDLIAKKGYDPVYGARPLRRAIQSAWEDPLSEKLLDGSLQAGQSVRIGADEKGEEFTFLP
ncbi:ATP-dependent Clp protease ATP-binding subunit ClpC [Clostridia bacterium]|nr:ATP-dependent Clp protease ATP-binding subunit ClpC [Clostridia bacterium]